MKRSLTRMVPWRTAGVALVLTTATISAALPAPPAKNGVRKALEQARGAAAARQQSLSRAAQPAALHPVKKTASDSGSGSNSGSMAANYGHGATLSVNERTFELTLDAPLVELTGISDGVELSIGLSYSSSDAFQDLDSGTQRFGLPYGWKYNISYIENRGTYTAVVIDGTQTYTQSAGFVTYFTPVGSTTATAALTGLLHYNRADANLQSDSGTVTIGGITSAYVLQNLDGTTRYFSGNGLLLEQLDRFGDTLTFFYNGDNTPSNALFDHIVDSWGNTVSFSYNTSSGTVTLTLPDGRTTSFVVDSTSQTVTSITDPMGLVTVLGYTTSTCGHGQALLNELSSAAGGMSAAVYQCMPVCTVASSSSCANAGNTTTWPVVSTFYDCPDNPSGTACPNTASSDYLTNLYTLGTDSSSNNYTGYPYYSPYDFTSTDPGTDDLMASNDNSFVYSTVISRLDSQSTTHYQVENDYNFLHLLTDSTNWVEGSSGLEISKQSSSCYQLTEASPASGCPTSNADYQALPGNYQLAVIQGSCVYPVDDSSESGNARVSVTVHSYDDFGQTTDAKEYFGTVSLGVATFCDRTTRLDPSSLKLVLDDYSQYDTPSAVNSAQYIPLGAGSGHYGLTTGHETLSYAEPQEDNLFGSLGTSTDPLLVRLTCSTLSSDGNTISAATTGLLPTSTAAPPTAGIISACTALDWDQTVAPPKVTSFTYDSHGRVLTRTTAWSASTTTPGGVSSTSDTLGYTLTATTGSEESCGTSNVLQTVLTDGQGNTTTSRVCTLNEFPLSSTDANGNTTTYQHDTDGLTTRVTYPNGTYITYDYYYPCPTAQDGATATCPSSSTALTNCPYDIQSPARSCMVQTAHAGTGNSSYADGILHASIRDGLGRVVLTRDNLGGVAGSGFTGTQTRATYTYDSLGLETSRTVQIGASNPLIYTTTTSYDAKLRPSEECSPRGMSEQYVRDDIAQQALVVSNGTQHEQIAYNDIQMPTGIVDCQLVAGGTQSTSGSCPTVAASTSSATCSGSGFYSYSLHDGSGLEHATLASGSGTETGASIKSVTGTATYSADSLVYGYSMTATPTDSSLSALTAASAFTRDLQGPAITMAMSVTDESGTTTTFSGDTYAYTNIDELQSATNNLSTESTSLTESYAYTPIRLLSQQTNYDGRVHHYYYDNMDRMVRYCYPSLTSGSEGETYTYDPLAGSVTSVTHFTNAGSCSSSSDGDVAGDSITYTFTRFGAVASKTYSTGASLQWGYDVYQRPVCFADAQATAAGSSCSSTPIAVGYAPAADQLLTYVSYWPDSDTYRRGFVESTCRGVVGTTAGSYETKCIDNDYYTSVDTGGSCNTDLSSIVGAYAGAAKTKQLCTGGSCLAGSGTAEYTTTYTYDDFGRQCEVESVSAAGSTILDSVFTYDQFNNLVEEVSTSALDTSTDSNYQTAYTYDGLMRVTGTTRSSLSGTVLETIAYTYDAASNITEKVQSVYVTDTPTMTTPTPTSGGIGGGKATPTPGRATTGTPTGTEPAPVPSGHGGGGGGGGCEIAEPAAMSVPSCVGAFAVLGCAIPRRRRRRCTVPTRVRRDG